MSFFAFPPEGWRAHHFLGTFITPRKGLSDDRGQAFLFSECDKKEMSV